MFCHYSSLLLKCSCTSRPKSLTCILKGFSWLVMSFNVQDGFLFESLPFKHHGVEESDFQSLILRLYGRVELISLFNNKNGPPLFYHCLKGRKYRSSIYLFHYDIFGLVSLCCINFVSICAMKIFRTRLPFLLLDLERVFVQD